MYTLAIRGIKPFCVLVGFELNIAMIGYVGYDPFGVVVSDDQGLATISLFL